MTAVPETTGQKQVNRGRFQRGLSGNPSGRPKGCRNRATAIAQQLMEGEAEAIARKAVDMSLRGDTTAMRLVLERLLPPRRSSMVSVDLGPIDNAEGVAEAQGRLLASVAAGEIAVDDALKVSQMLDARRSAIETAELAAEVAAIRAHVDGRHG